MKNNLPRYLSESFIDEDDNQILFHIAGVCLVRRQRDQAHESPFSRGMNRISNFGILV